MEFVQENAWNSKKDLRGENKIEILECIEKVLGEEGGQPSQFQGRVIFMSMYSDSLWWDPQKKKNKAYVETLQSVSQSSLKTSNQDDGLFIVLEMKKKGTEA